MNEAKRELGERLVERMFGGEHLRNRVTPCGVPEPCAYLNEYTTEEIFGGLWQRPQLDLKTRSLCTLASLVSLDRSSRSIRQHVAGALANGASPTEIVEVMVHTSFYAGAPVLSEAMSVALQVFGEHQDAGVEPAPLHED